MDKPEEVKVKRKPKVYKIMPYIVILMFMRYSKLNFEQTAIIILTCIVFYAFVMAIVGVFKEGKKH